MDSKEPCIPRISRWTAVVAYFLLISSRLVVCAATPDEEKTYQAYLSHLFSVVPDAALDTTWIDGDRLLYRLRTSDSVWLVDPEAKSKKLLLTLKDFAAQAHIDLTPALLRQIRIRAVKEGKVEIAVQDKSYRYDPSSGRSEPVDSGTSRKNGMPKSDTPRQVRKPTPYFGSYPVFEVLSPDSRLFATEDDHNLAIRVSGDDSAQQLTHDGTEKAYWSVAGASWSPNSRFLIAEKVDETKEATVPVVHWLEDGEPVDRYPVSTINKPLSTNEIWVADVQTKELTRVDAESAAYFWVPPNSWEADSSRFFLICMDTYAKRMDLFAVDPQTGVTKLVLRETSSTFINTELEDPFLLCDEGKSFLWLSDRSGRKGIYLYQIDGTLVRYLTDDSTVVVRVLAIDEKSGWIYFSAHLNRERPYDIAVCRVTLVGGKTQVLTPDPGLHDSPSYTRFLDLQGSQERFSPSKKFFIDTYSSVTRPPVSDLRGSDGRLIMPLETADTSVLNQIGWQPPEEFSVLAADKRTEIYGVIFKPKDFDGGKRYPVVDQIYAGPQRTWAPHSFLEPQAIGPQALAQLGFIVEMLDARGTPQRGKAFQDVVFRNFGRWEIPDHAAALRELAETRPYMDMSRVGVYGGSFGGYKTVRAMLLEPDLFKVGIANASIPDLFEDSVGSTEIYMGPTQDNADGYRYASNLEIANRLKGRLLLIHGTSDLNAPFSGLLKLADAFIKADKHFDLLVLPEQTHVPTEPHLLNYIRDATRHYFEEHLNQ
jgi:dipeptidyl-peptidase 4